jgi:glutathione synthase/RimK-type ligase-like ATP-grasp enzyme
MRLLGVYRERVFSPGKVREDAAILEAALIELSHRGHEFHLVAPEALDRTAADHACVLTMAQSARALVMLEELESRGTKVINSVASVRNCFRKPLIRLLIEAGLPLPRSRIMATVGAEEEIYSEMAFPCWIKRGDVHAVEARDVARVASSEELGEAIRHFRDRRIETLLVQEHIEGEVIKFYGVGSSGYFSAFLPSTGEEITSRSDELCRIGRRAAEAAGLDIYGGDAIATPEHALALIDLNDWPSFSRCCGSAAAAIARYVAAILEGD